MGIWRSSTAEDEPEQLARQLERLAALVRAGISIDRARAYLTEDPLASETAAPEARAVRASLHVAQRAGAGVAGAIEATAAAARERAELQRTLQTAMAGPKSTARLVLLLPLLGPAFAFALGMDPVAAMTSNLLGPIALVLGAVLMLLAWRWSARIIRKASVVDSTAGLQLELLAIAVRGGSALESARQFVADGLAAAALDVAPDPAADEIADLAERAGVPVRSLLESEARAQRHAAKQTAELGAAKAAVALTIPLGVCVLPAFVLLGVVPFVLATLQGLQLPI